MLLNDIFRRTWFATEPALGEALASSSRGALLEPRALCVRIGVLGGRDEFIVYVGSHIHLRRRLTLLVWPGYTVSDDKQTPAS
jgi:hypothetical protein